MAKKHATVEKAIRSLKFDDSTPHAEALLLTCIDFRFFTIIAKKMEDLKLTGKYDHFILAGAALGATLDFSADHLPAPKPPNCKCRPLLPRLALAASFHRAPPDRAATAHLDHPSHHHRAPEVRGLRDVPGAERLPGPAVERRPGTEGSQGPRGQTPAHCPPALSEADCDQVAGEPCSGNGRTAGFHVREGGRCGANRGAVNSNACVRLCSHSSRPSYEYFSRNCCGG